MDGNDIRQAGDRPRKKLTLSRETLRRVGEQALTRVAGGTWDYSDSAEGCGFFGTMDCPTSWTCTFCPQPSDGCYSQNPFDTCGYNCQTNPDWDSNCAIA